MESHPHKMIFKEAKWIRLHIYPIDRNIKAHAPDNYTRGKMLSTWLSHRWEYIGTNAS